MKTVIEIDVHPHHALEFEPSNPNWQENAEYNHAFLRAALRHMAYTFECQGHLFVNDVRKALGLDPTASGQVCGWIRQDGYIKYDIAERSDGTGNPWVTFEDQGVIVNYI